MDDFWSMIMRGFVQHDPFRGRYVWHDYTPKYIKKRDQGIVLPHEVKQDRACMRKKNVILLHRKISPLGKRSRKIWETWYLIV